MEAPSEARRASAQARPLRHRLLRGLAWGVGALGLIALGALGTVLGACPRNNLSGFSGDSCRMEDVRR